MARTLLIGRQFGPSQQRLGIIAGSDEAAAIARSMRVLSDSEEPLPFFKDQKFLMPPVSWVYAHDVPRTNLFLVYEFDDASVTFISVRRSRVVAPERLH